jgi:uncharacterized delta-60 repeat protein
MKKTLHTLLALFCFSLSAFAQPNLNDPTFNTFDDGTFGDGSGFDNIVYATSVQADGKIIVGGNFTSINGTDRNRITRLHPDGTVDTGFNPGTGFNSTVRSISIQADGKIIVVGDFNSFNGTPRNRITRLNADGSLDTSFNPGTGFNNVVYSTTIQADGKIIVGGNFTSFNGMARNRIARLNADGSLDTGFFYNSGANNVVHSTTIQADGKIIVGGNFTSFNGIARNRIARLNADGSLDTGFNPGSGFNNTVFSTTMQSDGKIIVAGNFNSFNGTTRNSVARLNADGSLDTGFDPGTGAGGSGVPSGTVLPVYSTSIQANGKIIVGGAFTLFGGTGRARIARLNANGTVDTSFSPNGFGFDNDVWSTSIQADGKIIVGGAFTLFFQTPRGRIACLYSDGSLDIDFNLISGFNSVGTSVDGIAGVSVTSIQADGKIIVGGNFNSFNGSPRGRIARLNADGSLDTAFNPGTGFNSIVRSISIQPDGKIIVGGDFNSFNGTPRGRIVRLNADGSIDATFNTITGFDNIVYSASIQADGKIIVVGSFTSFNGIARNRIARLNADGSLDAGFNPGSGFDNTVYSTSLQADGKIIVGGSFTSINGIARNRIARINADGSLDIGFNPGTGFNTNVRSISIQADGKIIVGGLFNSFNGTPRWRIARLNADGSLDTGFNPGTGINGAVYSTSIQADGKIILGGGFTTYNGTTRNNITRLNSDASLDTEFDPSSGFNDVVYSTSIQADGKIIVGGDFTSFNGTHRFRIARLLNCFPNTGTATISSCGNYTWLDGITYFASNNTATWTIINSDGCDSIVTLNLTITNPTTNSTTASACNSYTWAENGQTYTTSGTYTVVNSCHTEELILTITNSTTNTTATSACDSYTWTENGQTYTTSGTYTVVNGCHTEELVLTINQVSDLTLTLLNETLTANLSGASYQWLDCDNGNATITGANNQNYTATANGNYAVEITQNGCTATSDCYYVEIGSVGIKDFDSNVPDFNLYPNPNTGIFTFETTYLGKYLITNNLGQVIFDFDMNSEKKNIDLRVVSSGIYFISHSEGQIPAMKLIIH